MSGKSGLAGFLKDELKKPSPAEPIAAPENSATTMVSPTNITQHQPERKTSSPNITKPVGNRITRPVTTKNTKSVSNRVSDSEKPYYLTLTRKEVRLRDDQYDELTHLARHLNRQRTGPSERITENTLIRVAIDYLLSNENALSGSTEAELLIELEKA